MHSKIIPGLHNQSTNLHPSVCLRPTFSTFPLLCASSSFQISPELHFLKSFKSSSYSGVAFYTSFNPLASERDAHKESPAQSRFPSNSYKYGYVYPTPLSRQVCEEWTVLTGLVIAPPKQKAQKMSIGTFLADESK